VAVAKQSIKHIGKLQGDTHVARPLNAADFAFALSKARGTRENAEEFAERVVQADAAEVPCVRRGHIYIMYFFFSKGVMWCGVVDVM
jgi:hypothetical protein